MLSLLLVLFTLVSLNQPGFCLQPNQCDDKCGIFHIPFPFHLNASCATISNAFNLSCLNSTTLYLHIGIESYRVLDFHSDGILVDFPGRSSTCRQYNGFNSFDFEGNEYFGISDDNVIGLYDCEDSSLCKADCETNELPDCDGNSSGSLDCCYPLSDHSIWHPGNRFTSFSKFGCRGFSSWAVPPGTNTGKRGVKLEWAIPRNKSQGVCASNAYMVNATTVKAGVRCSCQNGIVGDGFANGDGCFKSCTKEGQEVYGKECESDSPNYSQRILVIMAGILAPVCILASLLLFLCILKRPVKPGSKHSNMPSVALQKIKSGKLEEIVDPSVYYHEQPIFCREQIEIVTDIATRCLLFGEYVKMGMTDVEKELFHLAKQSIDRGSKRDLHWTKRFRDRASFR